jgi:hypothetical protein
MCSYSIDKVFLDIPKLQHGNDGLIYTSVSTEYIPGTDRNMFVASFPLTNAFELTWVTLSQTQVEAPLGKFHRFQARFTFPTACWFTNSARLARKADLCSARLGWRRSLRTLGHNARR